MHLDSFLPLDTFRVEDSFSGAGTLELLDSKDTFTSFDSLQGSGTLRTSGSLYFNGTIGEDGSHR